jgi:hypothetical protein
MSLHNKHLLVAIIAATCFAAGSIIAQEAAEPAPSAELATADPKPKPTPSENVTINLLHRMVERGLLKEEDADALIKDAENDAAVARASAKSKKTATADGEAEPPAEGESPDRDAEDSVSVSYVPDIVKQQLRDEIKADVMEQARNENWANPRTFPTWVSRLTPIADIRLRFDASLYPSGNDNTGAFPNFNAINTGPPFDVTGNVFSPQLNVDQDRYRARIRVRGGAAMDLGDGFTMGLRIGTGETNTPTSTNQTLGVANNGQGGNFSKYAIWLDRAFVSYELGGTPQSDFLGQVGRFDNPFYTVSELMWDVDLGWDGLALGGKREIAKGITPFAAAGIFPVFNTELNFSSNRPDKFPSEDKWLYGGQAGVNLRFNKDFSAKLAGAFYDFYNIEGKLSDPFVPLTSADQGNTDDSRPAFAQKGNTYFPIRNIIPTADNGFGTRLQFQYFGLATPFRVVDAVGTVDYARFDPIHLTLFGEYLINTAFDRSDINAIAINNRGPQGSDGTMGSFEGGNVGWIVGIRVGHPALEKRWDWTAGISYRYIESDATVDAFNDSDFGGGGTNLKGYDIFGTVAVSPHISLALRWTSAQEIAGPTFRNNILFCDFNTKF